MTIIFGGGNNADNTSNQKVKVSKNGSLVGTRREVNMIEGSNVTLTVSDNAGSDRVDVTIASSGGTSGYATVQEEGSNLTQRSTIDFVGSGITASDTGAKTQVALSSNLNTYSGKTPPSGDVVGTSDSQTLSNKTLTAPRFADLGFIADANGNELVILDTVTSAVNEVTLANAATGNNPTITASGGDTNVGINLVPKGSGTIQVSGAPIVTTTATQTLTNKTLTSPVISTISNTGTVTLPTSTDTLVGRATTDTLTNKTINGSNNTLSNIGTSALGGDITAAGKALLDDADAAAQRTTLGLGSAATMTGPAGTIVGTSDSQTLSNKTLTAPRFADLGFIADANGNELIVLDTVTSAVNEITIANAATGNKPTITASGGDTNITLNLVPKGTGTVQAGGVDVVTTSGSQTLTNKTINGSNNTITNVSLSTGVTGTLPVANGGTGQTSYTDGQLLIGNTSTGGLSKATLTAGTNITITNGNGTIEIAASGGGGGASPFFVDDGTSPTVAPSLTSSTDGLAIGNEAVVTTGARAIGMGDSYASGADSFACQIGERTSSYGAQGANSIAMGYRAKTNSSYGAVLGGEQNTADQSRCFVGGGYMNSANANRSSIIGGENNTTSNGDSIVLGGERNSTGHNGAVLMGAYAKSATAYGFHIGNDSAGATAGRCMTLLTSLARSTADATPTVLQDAAAGSGITLPADSAMTFSIQVTGSTLDGTKVGSYEFVGCIKNDSGTTAFVGTPSKTVLGEDDASMDCDVTANNTNDRLDITVTGVAATTIYWNAAITASLVHFD